MDAIWLSPIYRSPMVDFGYDVADHCDVDPRFGILADADALVVEAHRRGYAFVREVDGVSLTVVLNFASEPRRVALRVSGDASTVRVLADTHSPDDFVAGPPDQRD